MAMLQRGSRAGLEVGTTHAPPHPGSSRFPTIVPRPQPPRQGAPRAASAPRAPRRSGRALLVGDGVEAVTFPLSRPTPLILETFQPKRQPGCSLPVSAQTHNPRPSLSLKSLRSESYSHEESVINADE